MRDIQLDFQNLIKNEIEIFEDCNVRAIFIGRNEDILIKSVSFVHSQTNIKSRISIKAILFDKSKFDFEGILKINKGAVGTDTYLKIDCLVMSETAVARVIPSLEINESEVKGGHGATIGYLDPEQLHYLKSKGLNPIEAEKVLADAFINF